MTFSNCSASAGTRLLAVLAGLLSLVASAASSAETVSTVNGAAIDSSVLDFYMQDRTQRPPAQVTAEERAILIGELEDLYLLSTQDAAAAVRDDPTIQAQIELQTRSLIAQAVATQYITAMNITDEEVLAEYQEQAELAPPLQYKARHILVESQGAAASIITELDTGSNFETLAKEKSTGPSQPWKTGSIPRRPCKRILAGTSYCGKIREKPKRRRWRVFAKRLCRLCSRKNSRVTWTKFAPTQNDQSKLT